MDRTHFNIPSSKTSNLPVGKGLGGANYVREDYVAHGHRISEQFASFKVDLSSLEDIEYSENVYAKIEVPKDVKIHSVKDKLDHIGINVTSVDPQNSSKGFAFLKKGDISKIEAVINDYANKPRNPLKSYVKFVESIAPICAEDKLKVDLSDLGSETVPFALNLHKEVTEEKADLLVGMLREKFNVGSNIDKFFIDDVLKMIALEANQSDITSICNEFSLIQSVNLNPPTLTPACIPSDQIDNSLIVNRSDENPTVIVIDSGVSNSGILSGLIKRNSQSLPVGVAAPQYAHGTFVASRIVFGDDLDVLVTNGQITSLCNIIDVAVFGNTTLPDGRVVGLGPSRTQLCSIIEATVNAYNSDSRVINISMGENTAIQDASYSQSAFVIDHFSRKYDMIFVVASGNINQPLGSFPSDHFAHKDARIGSPAESVLAITVGAIARHEYMNSLSVANQVSPFSRRGPGFNFGFKPDLVHHGGNLLRNYQPLPRIATSGLYQNGTQLATDNGTSFAAPIVSQIAARLFAYYEGRSSNLIKALMIHFSEPAISHSVTGISNEEQVGFGIPNYDRAIYARNHSATYLYEGKVKNDFFHIIKFHIPQLLASDNQNTKLKIKITVVANPPVNYGDIGRYIQSKVSVSLDKLNADSEKASVGLTSEDRKVTDWSPVQQLEKSFSRSYSPGEWELKVRGWTRGNLSEEFEQDFAVVIEIIDELNNGDPYTSILEETGDTYFTRVISIDRAA